MIFLSLPREIQVMVISRVSSIGGLAALSRSCRSIHHLCDMKTRERFYQIHVEPKDYSINKTFDLLMDILRNPKLGSYTNSHGEIHGTFIAQALAAILISVSPNLESLEMTQPFSVFSGFYRGGERPQEDDVHFPLDRLLRRANANPASIAYLQNLRKVYMIVNDRHSDDRFYMAIDFLECVTLFDRLPSIESISTDALCDDENGEARVVLEPRSSNVSRIHIHHSALPTIFLVSLIQSCKVLREFHYTIGGRCVLGGWTTPFNARTFIKSICPHKDTLEVLDIDAERNMRYFHPSYFEENRVDQEIDKEQRALESDDDDNDERQMIRHLSSNSGSLKEFRSLKRLSVGIGFLVYFAMGVRGNDEPRQPCLLPEALPESLEYLCIRGYEKGKCKKWDTHIDALVASFVLGSSGIKEITGIEETIPNSEDVEDPDGDKDLLWIPRYDVDY
ncbi:Pc22g03380 [Penicillium rubens Wisconsin 54-1255]|uniref:Pc22g03380 protein n=1 Tax=Penicillium rubens (strain ATCC 28089 / DSM 1075 / NRRL 1951 / Wisconsin 54-1255) TaxID=500485 RepID=B6HRC7_PENRW|nr:Pc22g03380 [Penicillium rubens Wisconsin 54-1255]